MISNRWKIILAALPIIGTCVLAQPQPGGLGGFFQAWYALQKQDPYEILNPTAYWYPSADLSNADRILGIASTNTVNTATTTANGWEFNGTSQYLDMGRPTEIELGTSTEYSMAVWVQRRGNLTGSFNIGGIMGKTFLSSGDRWGIFGSGANHRAIINEGTNIRDINDGASNPSNVWFHLASVIDLTTSNISLYVDGVRLATGSFYTTNEITYAGNVNVPFRFGSYNNNLGVPANYWNGYIDQAAVWNGRALTSNEVFNLFEQTKAGRK